MANAMFENVSPLARKKCKACEGEANKLSQMQINAMLGDAPGWEFTGGELARIFKFKNYYETMAFVNSLTRGQLISYFLLT